MYDLHSNSQCTFNGCSSIQKPRQLGSDSVSEEVGQSSRRSWVRTLHWVDYSTQVYFMATRISGLSSLKGNTWILEHADAEV